LLGGLTINIHHRHIGTLRRNRQGARFPNTRLCWLIFERRKNNRSGRHISTSLSGSTAVFDLKCEAGWNTG
jgi:hypothetical protein